MPSVVAELQALGERVRNRFEAKMMPIVRQEMRAVQQVGEIVYLGGPNMVASEARAVVSGEPVAVVSAGTGIAATVAILKGFPRIGGLLKVVSWSLFAYGQEQRIRERHPHHEAEALAPIDVIVDMPPMWLRDP